MSLYLNHFGLRESPYRITPHTEFFFDGANRGATLDALIYAIVHDEGIVKVTGEVGSGKTMLCRMLLERLPPSVETLYFANPSLNRDELLLALADELKLPAPPAHMHQLLRAIQQHLVDLHQAGKQVVILIDEAHAMPLGSLEEIRLLSNLETQRSKLLQIVLFGQPELNTILVTQEMRQLRERVTHNFFLEPLKQTDVPTYLMFRLRAAGYRGPDVFSPAAIKRFSEVSQGLTRRLNILGDKALLAAFAGNTHMIDINIANIAVADAHFDNTGVEGNDAGKSRRQFWLAGGIVAGVFALVFSGWLLGNSSHSTVAPPVNTSLSSPVAAPSVQLPAVATAPQVPLTDAPTNATGASLQLAEKPPAMDSGVAEEKFQAATQKKQSPSAEASPSLLVRYRGRFAHWIDSAQDHHYTIQLFRSQAHHTDAAEAFLRQASSSADPLKIYAYEASTGDQRWVGVVYGDYASAIDAEKALSALPSALRNNQPFVRSIRQLKP